MKLHSIGIDIGKTVFHLVGLSPIGEVIERKKGFPPEIFNVSTLFALSGGVKTNLLSSKDGFSVSCFMVTVTVD